MGTTLKIENSTISGNSALLVGGVVHGGTALTIENSTISGNTATEPSFDSQILAQGPEVDGEVEGQGRLTDTSLVVRYREHTVRPPDILRDRAHRARRVMAVAQLGQHRMQIRDAAHGVPLGAVDAGFA